jgi:hypothetical protein
MDLKRHLSAWLAAAALALLAVSCAKSSSGGSAPATPAASTGSVAMSVSDASTEDWSVIGVKLLGITLTPQGGGTPTTILATPAAVPVLNLVQLDNLSDALGTAQVPTGTYTKATLILSANPGDVTLTVASNPSATFSTDFPGLAGTTIPPANIQIKGATGAAGSLTVPVTVSLAKPLVVKAGQSSNLDLEFELSLPAFLIDHTPAGGGNIWTVNFTDTIRHHPVAAAPQMVLRQVYGTAIQAGASSITLTRDFPTLPIATPETATATPQVLQISPDTVNGTTFHDVDAKPPTVTTIKDFSSIAGSLAGRYVRAVLRFQPDGSLVAVRMWASSSFNNVWLSPEGHVTHVLLGSATAPYQIVVESEQGAPVTVTVNNETQFFYRVPADALADATPIATGTAFMDAHNLVRGFKVHVSYVDPSAATLVAESVDIENANYSGYISAATSAGFTYTRAFADSADDYTATLGYIPAATPNGNDAAGNPVTGFDWWDLTLWSQADTSASAIADFTGTVGGSVDFGGTVGLIKVWGASAAIPDAVSGWDARWVVLQPLRLPTGKVVTPFAADTFTMVVKGGSTTPVTVNLNSTTLVYQIDLAGAIYTVAPVDPTAGAATIAANLGAGSPVVVYGIPQQNGTIMASVLYYTTTAAL